MEDFVVENRTREVGSGAQSSNRSTNSMCYLASVLPRIVNKFVFISASNSPTKDNEKNHPALPAMPTDLHNNPSANLAYLQVE